MHAARLNSVKSPLGVRPASGAHRYRPAPLWQRKAELCTGGLSPHKFRGHFPLKALIIFHDAVRHGASDPEQHRRRRRRWTKDSAAKRSNRISPSATKSADLRLRVNMATSPKNSPAELQANVFSSLPTKTRTRTEPARTKNSASPGSPRLMTILPACAWTSSPKRISWASS